MRRIQLTEEQRTRIIEETEAMNKVMKFSQMCVDCRLAGRKRSNFPLDKKFKSSFDKHIKTHKAK